MRLCRPLALHCRDALLRILAHELRGHRDVGDGELHRIARTIIPENRLFDPPDLDGRMPRTSKWEAARVAAEIARRIMSAFPSRSSAASVAVVDPGVAITATARRIRSAASPGRRSF